MNSKKAASLLLAATMTVGATGASNNIYTVKEGDTLSSISQNAYGTENMRAEIAIYNNLNGLVKPGEVIALPIDIKNASEKAYRNQVKNRKPEKDLTKDSQMVPYRKRFHRSLARSANAKVKILSKTK